VESDVKHECDPGWKQLGTLADGILRSVMEKRMKQAEFLAAEKGPYEAPLNHPQAEPRAQLVLPFPSDAAPSAYSGARRI
jgi:hypothetical protein